MRLQIKNLSYSYDNGNAIENVSLDVKRGEFVGVIGPNGGGKSTLLKNVYRALTPDSGEILLDGENVFAMPYRKTAQKMAVVGQENDVPFDFNISSVMYKRPYPVASFLAKDPP